MRNVTQARLATSEKDLGMRGTDFNLTTSTLLAIRFTLPTL